MPKMSLTSGTSGTVSGISWQNWKIPLLRHLADEGRDSRAREETKTHIRGKSHTKIITLNLPEPFLAALEKLCEYGIYPSRSEALRVALRDFLTKEIAIAKQLEEIHVEAAGMKPEATTAP